MTSAALSDSAVRAVLAEFKDPETGRGVVEMDQVREVRLTEGDLSLRARGWRPTRLRCGEGKRRTNLAAAFAAAASI